MFQAFMDRHAIDFFDLFAETESGGLEAQGVAPGPERPPEPAGHPPLDDDSGGPLPYVPDPVAPLLWSQEAVTATPEPEEPATAPAAVAVVVPVLEPPAAPLVIAAPPVDSADPDHAADVSAGTPCSDEAAAALAAAPPVVEPAKSQNPYGIAPPNAIALAARAAAEKSEKLFAQPVDLVAAFLEHAPFLAHEDEKSEAAATAGSTKPKAPLQSADDKAKDNDQASALPVDAAALALLPLPVNNAPLPEAPAVAETPAGVASPAAAAASIVVPLSPNLIPRSAEAIRDTPGVPSPALAAPAYEAPVLTSTPPSVTSAAPAEAVDEVDEALQPLAPSLASTDTLTTAASPAPHAPPHKKTHAPELPEPALAPSPSSVPTNDSATAAVPPPVTTNTPATPEAAPRTAAEVSPGRQAGLSPLAAQVAALAAAASVGVQTGGAGSSSPDEQRREQPRGHAAEPAAAVAHRLAQTVQLMSGFERVLESTAPASTATAAAAPASLPNEPQVMSTILRSMHLQYQNGVGSAVITLDPEYLGGVTVSLQLSHGAVTASLQADRADVRAWLDANQHTLREALGQQGLSLDRLIVSDARQEEREAPSDDRRQQPRQPPPPRNSRKRREDEPAAFEVVV